MASVLRKSITIASLVCAACLIGGFHGVARADVALVFSSYTAKENTFNRTAIAFLKDLNTRSNGFVKLKDEFYSGALLKGPDSLKGTGRGISDLAFFCVGYTPAEQALTSMTEMPYVTEKGDANAMAMTELYETYPPLRAEYDAVNVEVLGFLAPSATIIGVDRVINSAADLKGLKTRGYGALGEIVRKGGDMVPVSIAFTDIYTSLQTGLINGYVGIPLWLPPTENWLKLTKTIVSPGIGIYFTCGIAMNKDKFNALPADVRSIVLKMRGEFPKTSVERVMDDDRAAVRAAQEAGVKFYQFTPQEAADWRNRVNVEAMEKEWIARAQKSTKADVAEFFTKYKALVKKYEPQSVYRSSFPTN